MVEDVITSGGSAHQAIAAVEQAGGQVVGVLAVVDREQGGRERIAQAGHEVVSLTTTTALGLGESAKSRCDQWPSDPPSALSRS